MPGNCRSATRSMSGSAPIRPRRFMFISALARGSACWSRCRWRLWPAPSSAFWPFDFGVAGVYFAILTIALAEFARVGFAHLELDRRLRRAVPAGRAIFPQRSLAPARPSGDVLLHPARRHRACPHLLPRAAAEPRRLFLAGDPRRRGGRAFGRHRRLPLQDDGGGDLRRHDVFRRRHLRLLLQQPVPRAGVSHLALDRDHPRADRRRHRHAVRADPRRLSC